MTPSNTPREALLAFYEQQQKLHDLAGLPPDDEDNPDISKIGVVHLFSVISDQLSKNDPALNAALEKKISVYRSLTMPFLSSRGMETDKLVDKLYTTEDEMDVFFDGLIEAKSGQEELLKTLNAIKEKHPELGIAIEQMQIRIAKIFEIVGSDQYVGHLRSAEKLLQQDATEETADMNVSLGNTISDLVQMQEEFLASPGSIVIMPPQALTPLPPKKSSPKQSSVQTASRNQATQMERESVINIRKKYTQTHPGELPPDAVYEAIDPDLVKVSHRMDLELKEKNKLWQSTYSSPQSESSINMQTINFSILRSVGKNIDLNQVLHQTAGISDKFLSGKWQVKKPNLLARAVNYIRGKETLSVVDDTGNIVMNIEQTNNKAQYKITADPQYAKETAAFIAEIDSYKPRAVATALTSFQRKRVKFDDDLVSSELKARGIDLAQIVKPLSKKLKISETHIAPLSSEHGKSYDVVLKELHRKITKPLYAAHAEMKRKKEHRIEQAKFRHEQKLWYKHLHRLQEGLPFKEITPKQNKLMTMPANHVKDYIEIAKSLKKEWSKFSNKPDDVVYLNVLLNKLELASRKQDIAHMQTHSEERRITPN